MERTKKYQAPKMELVRLDDTDVVTVSNGDVLVDVHEMFGPSGKWGNLF